MNGYTDDKLDPFNHEYPSATTTDIDASVFGKVDVPASGRVVAQSLSTADIWPDMRQPRRIIPSSVRGQWDGDPSEVEAILSDWHAEAEAIAGPISLFEALNQLGDGPEEDSTGQPIVDDYTNLLALAGAIQRDGLLNPITVVNAGGQYLIETGERRWLAHHLLAGFYGDDKFSRIPARIMDNFNVWRQAAENGRRQQLNAIGIARQIALLIMDMYADEDGVDFYSLDQMVLPGEPDRRFYAQVANGNIYRIKRGFGQRVLDVTGLKSMGQVRKYRGLLAMPDEIWELADIENWTEGRIRECLNPTESSAPPNSADSPENPEKTGYTVPIGTVSAQNDPESVDFSDCQSVGPNETLTVSQGESEADQVDESTFDESEFDRVDPEPQTYNPILYEYANGDVIWIVLTFLTQMEDLQSDNYIQTMCHKLMNCSPEGMRQQLATYQSIDPWLGWLDAVDRELVATMETAIAQFTNDLHEFTAYLRELGATLFESE